VSVECDKHGLLGIACEECLSQRRRDTIEEAARWLGTVHGSIGEYLAKDLRAALLGKQTWEAAVVPASADTLKRLAALVSKTDAAPAPAEGAGEVCGACGGRRVVWAIGAWCTCSGCNGTGRTPGRSR
jgi:hypothetical protein